MNETKKRKITVTSVVLTLMIIVTAAGIAMNMTNSSGQSGRPAGGPPSGAGRPSDAPEGAGPEGAAPGGDMSAFPGMESSDDSETVYTVKSENVIIEDLSDYLKLNGDVIPETSVDLYPDTSGKLTTLNVDLGDYVRKGDIIAEIDPSLPGQVFSLSPVRSTITGTITDLPYQVGATISATSIPIATVGDLKELQVQLYIAEREIAAIKTGLNAVVEFEAYPGEVFHAVLSEMSPVLNRTSRTVEVKLTLAELDSRIRSGMFGSVKLITEVREDSLTIALDSIIESTAGDYVYVIDGEGVVSKRLVETDLEVDGRIQITDGLVAGEQVVSRGQTMLQDGSLVRIAE